MKFREEPTLSDPIIDFAKLPHRDEEVREISFFMRKIYGFRHRLRNGCFDRLGREYWSKVLLLGYSDLHRQIGDCLRAGSGVSIGRLGGVEASLVMWAKGIPSKFWRPDLKPVFSDTAQGATNAGIRPRNRESYRAFAGLAWDALQGLDFQGVWKSGQEALVLSQLNPRYLFDVEVAGPDGNYREHWTSALKGKKVLVLSPFEETIRGQLSKLKMVWPNLDWFEGVQFEVVRFPYLIDEDCPETWWEVYERLGSLVSSLHYDVALFGCGGLGLLFAHLAKKAGRAGIHLGGHMQLMFGIFGERHLHHEWHRKHINEAWVRPDPKEVPKSAMRVEGGCYW